MPFTDAQTLAFFTDAAQMGIPVRTREKLREEGIDAIEDVIRHIETYDVTTIRASTPMYLMARQIKAMGIKMVLCPISQRSGIKP